MDDGPVLASRLGYNPLDLFNLADVVDRHQRDVALRKLDQHRLDQPFPAGPSPAGNNVDRGKSSRILT
jgi:hypothetical protein